MLAAYLHTTEVSGTFGSGVSRKVYILVICNGKLNYYIGSLFFLFSIYTFKLFWYAKLCFLYASSKPPLIVFCHQNTDRFYFLFYFQILAIKLLLFLTKDYFSLKMVLSEVCIILFDVCVFLFRIVKCLLMIRKQSYLRLSGTQQLK